jgi:gamma-tubulin complex component 5
MAPSTTIGSLTDELVASLIPTRTPASKVRKFKDTFNKQLRHHNHARTNQFEVAGRLDGLQEKFLILNRDDLADALHTRLRELKTATPSDEKWLPDILHLLLQLSRDPAQTTKVDEVTKEKPLLEMVRPLRWAEVEVEDPIDRRNKIWENPDFSDLSSDEDVFIASSEPSSPAARQKDEHADNVSYEDAYLVDRELSRKDEEHPVLEQIWQTDADTEIVITELQAVRETLFMLQGLPTTLFWRVGQTIEVDKRFRLNHASLHLLRDILKSFANIGLRVDLVRTWLKEAQTVPFMQILRVEVEQKILDFDSCVSQMQSELLASHQSTLVSLAKTFDDIIEHSKVIMHLASFFEHVMLAAADSIECLDLFYITVCSCHASGAHDLFEPLSHLFIKVFEVYLEPILRWIEFGELGSSLTSTIVGNSIHERSLPGLWQEWYNLNSHPGSTRNPRFMQQLIHQIFLAGKTQVFLRHLPDTGQGHPSKPTDLTLIDIRLIQSSSLLPFSEAFEVVIKRAIERLHRSSSAQLREKLAHECGLWRTLDALHSIFLGRSGWAIDAVDARIFDRIDQGNQAWNDRYLLTELYRNTYEGVDSIDTQRITVQTGRASSRDMQSQRRSVKMLENIIVTYSLPWPVANIISDGALRSYTRVSTFLFQIRRARYVLERRCRFAVMSERLDLSLAEQRLAQKIHSQLLIFVNYLYDHLTLFTIEHTTGEMRQALTEAIDVDGIIQVYHSYISKLEDMCLVSRRVGTIRRAVLNLLDLCIRFSDIVTSPLGRRTSVDAQSFKSAASRLRDQYKRRDTDGSSSDEDLSDSEGFSTFIIFDETSYEGELSHIKEEFDRHRSFLVAGLKSIGRVEEQNTGWDVLAERLSWKASLKP